MAKESAYHPIIYVRGYAGSQGAVENTVATPYMGFNKGSTKFRQAYDKKSVEPWVFESPLLRLMKDHQYIDAYSHGELLPSGPTGRKSIWIFRYYDDVSKDFGTGKRKEIEDFALDLRDFIRHVLAATKAKKVYLVAHSMGGLICRCYLQNSKVEDLDGKKRKNRNTGVDKLFTYATPHGGIEFRPGLGWVESIRDFLKINNSDNFGKKRMKGFLDLPNEDVQSMSKRFPADRVFSLVGTDARDYGAAAGLSRVSVGPMSDGLVQIANAYVKDSPRAFVHRSHSGHYGIVNSEEGYQSLRRFLFGDMKAQLVLNKVQVELPNALKRKKNVDTTYFIETVVSIRGIPVEVHRRTMNEGASIHRNDNVITSRPTHLYTAFLDSDQMIKRRKKKSEHELGFLVRVRIVPQYHVDKKLWRDDHFEGKPVFEDALEFIVTMKGSRPSGVKCDFSSELGGRRTDMPLADAVVGSEPIRLGRKQFKRPLIQGDFEVRVSKWNNW
jgi:pimeloyl-ACP methyl ester carboxylesterase